MLSNDFNNSVYSAVDSTSQPQNSLTIHDPNHLRQSNAGYPPTVFYLQFKNAEDVYKYLVKVGTVLVVERDKIT